MSFVERAVSRIRTDDRLAFTLVHDTIEIVTVKAGVSEFKYSISEESQIERRAATID